MSIAKGAVTAVTAIFCLQSCRMGAEAALAVLDAKSETAPSVICLDGNKITKRPLMECVDKVKCSSLFCFLLEYLGNIQRRLSSTFIKVSRKIFVYLMMSCLRTESLNSLKAKQFSATLSH